MRSIISDIDIFYTVNLTAYIIPQPLNARGTSILCLWHSDWDPQHYDGLTPLLRYFTAKILQTLVTDLPAVPAG